MRKHGMYEEGGLHDLGDPDEILKQRESETY